MSTKVSTGFGWLEDDVTGDPAGVRRHRDGKEFNIPLVETDPVTGGVDLSSGVSPILISELPQQEKGPLSMELAAPEDVPTITYAASSGYGSNVVDRLDTRITYWGGPAIASKTTGGFGQMWSPSTSLSYVAGLPFFHEYGYDGAALVIRAGIDSGKQKWYLWVDGRLAATSKTPYSATAGVQDITITWATARPRVITFLSAWGVHKITLDSAMRTVWKVSRKKGRKLAIVGDSWGKSEGDALAGWGYQAALSLGYSDIVISTQGGTGYYATGTAGQGRRSFSGRFADEVLAYGFDDLIVNGSINDLPAALPGVSRADVIAGIKSFYDAVFAANPKARVWTFGCQYIDPTKTANYAAMDVEISGVVSQFKNLKLFSSSGWMTGTGKSGTTVGDGNRDLYRSSDGDHCTDAGYTYWAGRQVSEIRNVI